LRRRRELSSSEESMLRSAGASRKTLTGNVALTTCTQTIPHQENTSKTGSVMKGNMSCSHTLIRPVLPPASKIQAIVTGRAGMNSATQKPTSSQPRPGKFVRAITQAIATPSTSEINWRAKLSDIVLQKAEDSCSLRKASYQLPTPVVVARPSAPTWKLVITSVNNG
jgi:hypothetical protein